ncbi:MAG TPA: hypothetical protein VFG63_01040 [Nocardioidaceae bacterium]|nr:hypothetical protein [Nocardioidaceae bacterium]
MTTRVLLAGVLLLPVGLSGCSSATETYCASLADEKQTLTDLAGSAQAPGADAFADSLTVFRRLRDDAPGDIRDEWDTYVFAWEGVTDAFTAAGVNPQDYTPGTTQGSTPGVTEEQARAIEDAAAELRSPRVLDAGKGIEQHARDVCKVDLGL